MEGPWDEVWLDWSLGFTIYGGDYMVDTILTYRPEGVGAYFVHTSDTRAGKKMTRRLNKGQDVPARYVPDIDYSEGPYGNPS